MHNPANVITWMRLIFGPLAASVLILSNYFPALSRFYFDTLVIFMLLVGTDWLDGYIARRTKCETRLGQFLDPLADKIIFVSFLIPFWGQFWGYGVIAGSLLVLELFFTIRRILRYQHKELSIKAVWLGKIKVNLEYMAVFVLLASLNIPSRSGFFTALGNWFIIAAYLAACISTIKICFRAPRPAL